MMKTTFLLGLPRCGSFALSLLMNNHKCLAHHEMFDFEMVSSKRVIPYDRTDSFRMRKNAYASGRSYFNCDSTVSAGHLTGLVLKTGYTGHEFQVVSIHTNPDKSCDYLYRHLLEFGKKAGTNLKNLVENVIETQINMSMEIMTHYARHHMPMLMFGKEENPDPRHFTKAQLTEMAKFVGAWPDDPDEQKAFLYAGRGNMSISDEMMQSGLSQLHSQIKEQSISNN